MCYMNLGFQDGFLKRISILIKWNSLFLCFPNIHFTTQTIGCEFDKQPEIRVWVYMISKYPDMVI